MDLKNKFNYKRADNKTGVTPKKALPNGEA
jgi:hypothetical protein